jgi:putative ABC transport system ATP-binding protein
MIKIINLTKTFKDFKALDGINLEIKRGSLVVLKGISGSGKSTLLSIIAALQKPTSGDILIDGLSINKLPDLHSSSLRLNDIGFVAQDFKLLDSLSVEENISLPLIALGLSPKQINQKIKSTLTLAHIAHKKDSLIRDLSGGEKQRVAIARSLGTSSKIMLFDEPTANLDSSNSHKFIDLLSQLKELNKTIIIATHDPLFDELSIVDRYIHIESGVVVDGE